MTGAVGRRSFLSLGLGAATCALALSGCTDGPPPVSERPSAGGAAVTPGTDRATAASTHTGPGGERADPTRSALPSLAGDTRNAWAFAPLATPAALVVEGSVPQQRAWSTSKVLVVAALLATAAQGDPARLTADQQGLVSRALAESDAAAIRALKAAIQGDPARAMNGVLRAIGDDETQAVTTYEGTMTWPVAEQVRFMAALAAGLVVSPAASSYLLGRMQPVPSQAWGLPSVGASAAKGGWLRANTETRQMGLLDGFAVAVITSGVGPVVTQSDGDAAHVDQLNILATALKQRLGG